MARVTSKLQVTVPKAVADQFGIRPGDDLDWVPAGTGMRVQKVERRSRAKTAATTALRLRFFDAATERQRERQQGAKRSKPAARGWKREDLYDRGRAD